MTCNKRTKTHSSQLHAWAKGCTARTGPTHLPFLLRGREQRRSRCSMNTAGTGKPVFGGAAAGCGTTMTAGGGGDEPGRSRFPQRKIFDTTYPYNPP